VTEQDGAEAGEQLAVELAATGRTVLVPAGLSILEALLDEGVDVPFSCMEGICGSCRTTVVAGLPRHRDSVLTAADRAAGDSIMVCCSGAEGGRIVLDL
jgi:vanillate O-demethylase ferredoxin subunit